MNISRICVNLTDLDFVLALREKPNVGVCLLNAFEPEIDNFHEALDLISIGTENRHIACTAMNRESSRSHSILSLYITKESQDPDTLQRSTTLSRFNLVDLAGSERQKETLASGERLYEAGKINQSLTALGALILSLTEKSRTTFARYRDSKLTYLLKDSLGGNSLTLVIATINPADYCLQESISTLQFASRVKRIRNHVKVNVLNTSDASIEDLHRKNKELSLRIEELEEVMNSDEHHYSSEALKKLKTEIFALRDLCDKFRMLRHHEKMLRNLLKEELFLTRSFSHCVTCDEQLEVLQRIEKLKNAQSQLILEMDSPSVDLVSLFVYTQDLEEALSRCTCSQEGTDESHSKTSFSLRTATSNLDVDAMQNEVRDHGI